MKELENYVKLWIQSDFHFFLKVIRLKQKNAHIAQFFATAFTISTKCIYHQYDDKSSPWGIDVYIELFVSKTWIQNRPKTGPDHLFLGIPCLRLAVK